VRTLILCLLLLVRATTLPAQYQDETIRLAVPTGFEGPEVLTPAPGFKMVNFAQAPGTGRGTLLQITIIDTDVAGLSPPGPDRIQAAESHLAEFLSGVERRRSSFQVVSRDRIELSGLPAARAAWRGVAGGRGMHGVLYSVIVGDRKVTFHTQTVGDAPQDHLSAAVQAIESVVLQP
jgi:hypothetical protein